SGKIPARCPQKAKVHADAALARGASGHAHDRRLETRMSGILQKNSQRKMETESRSKPKPAAIPYPFAFGATNPSGNFAPAPKKNCSSCSSMIFCEFGSSGFNRYSFMIILESFIPLFHASLDTLSYTRFPNSPRHGTRSSPGKSLSNFTQCTIRVPAATGCVEGFSGSHESFATASSHTSLESLPYFICLQIPS